jgi:hypothetical protein
MKTKIITVAVSGLAKSSLILLKTDGNSVFASAVLGLFGRWGTFSAIIWFV